MYCYGGVWAYGDDERKYLVLLKLDAMRKAMWRAEVCSKDVCSNV
jgi:hypothetical protein